MEKLFKLNKDPKKAFPGAQLELDTTAFELQEDYPERINLRLDFPNPVSRTHFVETVNKLMDESYPFSSNKYPIITSEINKQVFNKKE